jgi:hypothetical protein
MKKSVLCFLLVTGLEGGNSALEYSSPLGHGKCLHWC